MKITINRSVRIDDWSVYDLSTKGIIQTALEKSPTLATIVWTIIMQQKYAIPVHSVICCQHHQSYNLKNITPLNPQQLTILEWWLKWPKYRPIKSLWNTEWLQFVVAFDTALSREVKNSINCIKCSKQKFPLGLAL